MIISLLIFLLVSNAVTLRRDKSILFSRVVVKTLFLASFIALNNLYIKPLEQSIGIYGGLFNVSTFTQSFDIFIFLVSAAILTLTAFYPRKVYIKEFSSLYKILTSKFTYNKTLISNKTGENFRIIEYALIIVFIICGAVFLVSTGDLISLFLSIELQSYGLYILSTLYRDSESATASGLTYFLLGGLSSCFILLGSALVYANLGTTSLDNIFAIYNEGEIFFNLRFVDLALVIMLVGFFFKVSAAPFHFWSPDVYDGIPTIVTTYVAIIAKISIFALFIVLTQSVVEFEGGWQSVITLSSFFSLIIGSVLGLTQSRIKRLFAYSTISHVGFILLAIGVNNTESIQACIFYLFQYTIANLNAFIILLSIGFSLYIYVYEKQDEGKDNSVQREKLIDRNNSPIQLISQIKGYFYINSFLSISLAITFFSFIGVPPIAGFFAKQMILSAALDKGMFFMTFVAILTSVIGAAYYLNIIKQIFFFKSIYNKNSSLDKIDLWGYVSHHDSSHSEKETVNTQKSLLQQDGLTYFKPENITLNSALSSTISIITLLLLLFIYIPGEWFNIVSILTFGFF